MKHKHFLFVDDYEINPKYHPIRKKTPVALGLSALYILQKYKKSKKNKNGGSSGSRKHTIDRRQKCMVKVHISYEMEGHKYQINEYLRKEGKGKDGQTPQLYGVPEDIYRKNMVNKNFRIILSPGSSRVPLSPLAHAFIHKLQLQTNYDLYWLAAEHYDTAHPHVHLLINGKDKNGRDIYFSRDLIKTLMRETARNICTSLIGSRTKEDIRIEQKELLTANRFTYIDEKLKMFISDDNTLKISSLKKNRDRYAERLSHLQLLGLCKWEKYHYIFDARWEYLLKKMSRYNMFLDARNSLQFTSKHNFHLYDSSMETKQGIITKIYKTDEISDNYSVVLEAIDGNAYFIPLFKKPSAKEGYTVTIETKQNQKGRLAANLIPIYEKELLEKIVKNKYNIGYADYLKNKNQHTREQHN